MFYIASYRTGFHSDMMCAVEMCGPMFLHRPNGSIPDCGFENPVPEKPEDRPLISMSNSQRLIPKFPIRPFLLDKHNIDAGCVF